ncbi:hypothetical protein IEQ34_000936 [Dendrobium chrysotoxum]|uniref:Uncharacterized protein n=1 Tax=Dendrobium chrysotoxum TaxID=161865 RepID=A0AAV7HMT6_DENCH|nr:hypothetical protein IEQ34_000936 [Dendrobium chrysotoxum]
MRNKSLLVIEDIDCSIDLQNGDEDKQIHPSMAFSFNLIMLFREGNIYAYWLAHKGVHISSTELFHNLNGFYDLKGMIRLDKLVLLRMVAFFGSDDFLWTCLSCGSRCFVLSGLNFHVRPKNFLGFVLANKKMMR